MMLRKLGAVIQPLKSLTVQNGQWILLPVYLESRMFSLSKTNTSEEVKPIEVEPKKKLSKAMKAYLERARENEEFMKKQREEFQIGKRHLANMMGENPETFTQEDIDNAIEYLFPSGLYEKRARPLMKPPEEVFPQRKAAEFDETGRPYHFLFYTSKPNFYQVLHEIVQHMNDLYKFEDIMIRKNLQPDPNLTIVSSGFRWLEKEELENILVETIGDRDYNSFINALERLSALPYSYRVKDFIMKYKKPLMSQTQNFEIPKPQYDSDGRAFITTYECRRKTATANVTIRSPGTGKISINGQDIDYFKELQEREQLLFPLIFTHMIQKVDVECNVTGGGCTTQAGAIRFGISWGLRSFVDEDMIEQMRIAGLLSRDFRTKERKKPGQAGARKKFTWKKR